MIKVSKCEGKLVLFEISNAGRTAIGVVAGHRLYEIPGMFPNVLFASALSGRNGLSMSLPCRSHSQYVILECLPVSSVDNKFFQNLVDALVSGRHTLSVALEITT